MKIDELIKTKRTALNLTQKQLAEALFLSPKTISRWETGRGFPDLSMIPKLAEVLGITGDEILASLHDNPVPSDQWIDPGIKSARFISLVLTGFGSFLFIIGYTSIAFLVILGIIIYCSSIVTYLILESVRIAKIGPQKKEIIQPFRIRLLWTWYAIGVTPISIVFLGTLLDDTRMFVLFPFIVMISFLTICFLIGYFVISLKKR